MKRFLPELLVSLFFCGIAVYYFYVLYIVQPRKIVIPSAMSSQAEIQHLEYLTFSLLFAFLFIICWSVLRMLETVDGSLPTPTLKGLWIALKYSIIISVALLTAYSLRALIG